MRTGRPVRYKELDAELIRRLYENEQMTVLEIAQRYQMSDSTLHHYMKRWNIKLRNPKEAHGIAIAKGRMKGTQLNLTCDELKRLYYGENMSLTAIARHTGCTQGRIWRAFIGCKIPRRNASEALNLRYAQADCPTKWRYQRSGYIYIKQVNHHRADKDGWACEHIVTWKILMENNCQMAG
mgnify:FL=1